MTLRIDRRDLGLAAEPIGARETLSRLEGIGPYQLTPCAGNLVNRGRGRGSFDHKTEPRSARRRSPCIYTAGPDDY